MRMSRKRGRKLRERLEKEREEQLGKNAGNEGRSFRMSRRRHHDYQWNQKPMLTRLAKDSGTAATAAIAATIATAPLAEASSMQTLLELPGTFQAMRDARDRNRNIRALKRETEAARINLAQAQEDVRTALNDSRSAQDALRSLRASLNAARVELVRVGDALAEAEAEALSRKAEADEAEEKRDAMASSVEEKREEVYAARERYESFFQGSGEAEKDPMIFGNDERGRAANGDIVSDVKRGDYGELAQRIERAWESVGFQQNRLREVEAMVRSNSDGIISGVTGNSTNNKLTDKQAMELESAIAAAQNDVLELESELDAMEEAFDALSDEADELMEAAADARDEADELASEQESLVQDINELENDEADTITWNDEADSALDFAEQSQRQAELEVARALYEQDHMGDGGVSAQTRFDYYNWHGPEHGHQLVVGESFYKAGRNIDIGIETGFVHSSSGREHGTANGMLDTTLNAVIKNDNKKYDVHYEFAVNLPTGRTTHQNAQLPEGVARHTSFGEGWGFTPGIAVTHHFNEEDSLTGRLSFSWKGNYDYRLSEYDDAGVEHIRESSVQPGEEISPEVVWLHAGDKGQAMAKAKFTATSVTTQDGHKYRDGTSVDISAFYSHDFTKLDSFQLWMRYLHSGRIDFHDSSWDSPNNRGVSWREAGIGWTHDFDVEHHRSFHLMANYQKAHGDVYRFTTYGRNEGGEYWLNPRRLSIMASYEVKTGERDALELRLERYYIYDRGVNDYRGWGGMVMYTHSF